MLPSRTAPLFPRPRAGLLGRRCPAWWALLLLPWLAACSPPAETRVFAPPTLIAQGERLYLRMEMEPSFRKGLLSSLSQGNPLFLTYRIRLREKHLWLPDETVAGINLKRRARMHLITRRYRLQDVETGQESYADDEDEATRFLGHPLFLPLMPLANLDPGKSYFCRIQFRMEDEGVSQVFRVLHRWLTWETPAEQEWIVEYRNQAG